MTLIAATNLRAFKNATITIDADDYRAHVSSAQFGGLDGMVQFTGLDGKTHTDTIQTGSTLALSVVQDWVNPLSLCNYLFDNAGTEVSASIAYEDGPTFTSQVTLLRPAIGGAVNEFNESTVSLPCTAPVKSVTAVV